MKTRLKELRKMRQLQKLIFSSVLIAFLVGCAETKPFKSPCNWSGSNCWPRTKINEWDVNQ